MANWEYNNKYIQSYNLKIKNIQELEKYIHTSTNLRPNFNVLNSDIVIPRIFVSIVGIENSENEYYDKILDLKNALSSYNDLFLFIDSMEVNLNAHLTTKFEEAWNKVRLYNDIQSNQVIKIFKEFNLFPKLPNKYLEKQISDNLEGIIDYYFEVSHDLVDELEMKNILLTIIHFLNFNFFVFFKEFDYVSKNPKIMYYGDINKSLCYTLIYFSSLGVDIIYLNQYSDKELLNADPFFQFFHRIEYSRKLFPKPFPTAKTIQTIETPASLAQTEIRRFLFNEETKMYMDKQLNSSKMHSVHLKTTYDEIGIWIKDEKTVRHGFKN